MYSLKAAYINELYKISKKKKVIVAASLSMLALLVASFIVMGVSNFMGINVTGASEFSIMVLPVLNNTLIPLFTAFVCIDMFSGEFSNQTIKTTLTTPASRFKIFTAKVCAVATFIAANLFFIMFSSIIISVFVKGVSMGFGKIFLSYLFSFFPLFVFALMVILISNLSKGSGGAFMLSILAFLLLKALEIIFSNYSSFFFTSTFDFYILFTGISLNIQKILRTLLILSGFGIMLFTSGYMIFDRKEI